MKLIDADELKELYEDYEGLKVPCEVVLQNIDDMPTAYDIDDIIKQLEKERERQRENAIDRNYRIGVVNGLNVSIGIVKAGAE